jgi:hypothetical protein
MTRKRDYMKTKFAFIFAVLFLLVANLSPAPSAHAQAVAYVVGTTQPVDAGIRSAIDAWLAVSPPSSAVYYGITYVHALGDGHIVCLAGLNIVAPEDHWSLTGDKDGNSQVVWMGTVTVASDGTVTMKADDPIAKHTGSVKLAIPSFAPSSGAGGGPYVRFPMQSSKAWFFGINAIHAVGYGNNSQNNWRAVDLVGGTDYGSGGANDSVYASVSGTVDFVCKDDMTTAIRITGNGDSFVYAHLLDNANLEIDHEFSANGTIGTLKHGSFSGLISGNCGNAVQTANHWHLHWGFIMAANGKFQAEGCILSLNGIGLPGDDVFLGYGGWQCGNTLIKPGDPMTHVGDISDVLDDGTVGYHILPGGNGRTNPSFFTMLENGIGAIFDALVTNNLPEHGAAGKFILPILNSVKIVFRIASVLVFGYFNLKPAMGFVTWAIMVNLSLTLVYAAGTIMRIRHSAF